MKAYYINTRTWDRPDAEIIDEITMENAEQGLNSLNPEEFLFLCEADSLEQAKEAWAAAWNQPLSDILAKPLTDKKGQTL